MVKAGGNMNVAKLAVTAALGLSVFFMGIFSTAYAAPALVQIGVGSCSMADGDGNFFTALSPNIKVKVVTQNSTTLVLFCEVDSVANHTGKAVIYNVGNTGGAQCTINDPLLGGNPIPTNRWQETVSAGGPSSTGNAVLSCTVTPPSGK
jgi:hypothetical protein